MDINRYVELEQLHDNYIKRKTTLDEYVEQVREIFPELEGTDDLYLTWRVDGMLAGYKEMGLYCFDRLSEMHKEIEGVFDVVHKV